MIRLKTTISGLQKVSNLALATFIVAFTISSNVRAAENVSDETPSYQSVLGFADNLFENKDYYRAITEYKRFIYLFPNNPLLLNARYKIGMSYFKGEKYNKAEEHFKSLSILPDKNEVTKKSLFKLAEVYYKDLQYYDAAQTYLRFTDEYPDAFELHDAKYKSGWAYLRGGFYDEAKNGFNEIKKENPYFPVSQKISTEMDGVENLPYRSPRLAGGLSAVLPGAGQLYSGRYQDAIAAFLLNGAFIWGTVELFEDGNDGAGGVLAFFSLMWYSGNIYSAISSAHKFNRDSSADFINNLDRKYNFSLKYDKQTNSKYVLLGLRW